MWVILTNIRRIDLRAVIVSLLLLFLVTTLACGTGGPTEEELRGEVVTALDALAADLAEDRQKTGPSMRTLTWSAYDPTWMPTPHSTGAPRLDHDGRVTASPYVYRAADGYATLDLAVPSYNIDSQAWVTEPLAANSGVWTAPYFDAGGGEIWMVTRSIPVRDAEGVFALVTTDLPAEAPDR